MLRLPPARSLARRATRALAPRALPPRSLRSCLAQLRWPVRSEPVLGLLSRALLLSFLLPGCGPLVELPAADCGGLVTEIGSLQGTGSSSPREHERATVEGIVTLVAAGAEPPGFFLQSSRPDDDPHSSEGLFVLAGEDALRPLAPGLRVRIRGRVAELDGRTTLGELELLEPCGKAALEPVPVTLGRDVDARHLENMLVHSAETWTLLDTSQLERSGHVLISPHGRSYAVGHPLGGAAQPHWQLEGLAGALGGWLQAGTVSEHLRLGANTSGLRAWIGPGSPPLLLANAAVFRAQPAPAAPVRPQAALRIAALNLDNYFSELGSRGARTEGELTRQRAKLVALLRELDADVLALSELGNATPASPAASAAGSSLADLLAALEAESAGELAYRVSEPAIRPAGPLRSAIAYRSPQLQPLAAAWFAADEVFARGPLVQHFASTGGSFTLVVVHLKSKLCSGAAEIVGTEGCGAQQRLSEARALLRLLASLPASEANSALVIGDFNADALEAPLRELRAGGLLDLLEAVPAAERYSYVFEGRASQLDHALGGPALAERVRGAHLWHINADEPALLGYELEHAPRAYVPDARRASDHDPIIIDLAQ